VHEVTRAEGPERLSPDWLATPEKHTCDHYRVEDSAGRRYWLFREGLYGQEGLAPRWFMGGLFA
jgi:protein ImuB